MSLPRARPAVPASSVDFGGSGMADQLGITLLYLPSYSPNLNLIERLWKFVKKTSLNSCSYDTFAKFQAAIDQCLDELFTTHAAEVITLLTPKFQTFEKASILAA